MIRINVFQNKETKRYFYNFTNNDIPETVSKPEYAKVWIKSSNSRMSNLKGFMKNNLKRLNELGFELIETEVEELL
jgi:hypothetical protein